MISVNILGAPKFSYYNSIKSTMSDAVFFIYFYLMLRKQKCHYYSFKFDSSHFVFVNLVSLKKTDCPIHKNYGQKEL